MSDRTIKVTYNNSDYLLDFDAAIKAGVLTEDKKYFAGTYYRFDGAIANGYSHIYCLVNTYDRFSLNDMSNGRSFSSRSIMSEKGFLNQNDWLELTLDKAYANRLTKISRKEALEAVLKLEMEGRLHTI